MRDNETRKIERKGLLQCMERKAHSTKKEKKEKGQIKGKGTMDGALDRKVTETKN